MMRAALVCRTAGAALLCAHAALAAPVTVTVNTGSGAPAADTILILDPLGGAAAAGRGTASIDQVNKRFVPRVSVVRTGTAVTFPNSDNIRHQVYSFSEAKKFSLKLYAGSPKMDVVFDKPGLVVLGCNIHDSMVAFVAVVDTPYFGRLPDAGTLSLDLPPGRYRLRLWNPALALPFPPREVAVQAVPLALAYTIELDPKRETVAEWPE